MAAPTGFTQVTGSKVTDSSGVPITNATIYFQPCDWRGNWVAYCVNSAGQAMWESVSTQVQAGAFSIILADTKLTSPQNIYFQVRIFDNVSGADLLGPNYFIQPTGPTWNFDSFIPAAPNLPLVLGVPVDDVFFITGPGAANVASWTLTRKLIALLGLYYNGVLLIPGTHFNLVGQTFTVTFAVTDGDNLFVSYLATTP